MTKRRNRFLMIISIGVISAVILACVSCSKQAGQPSGEHVPESLNQPFSAMATIKMKDITAVADINKTSPQEFTMRIVEPAALKDVAFTYNGETIRVSYKGMGVDIKEDSMIANTMAGVMIRSINAATEGSGVQVERKDGALMVKGENEDGKFDLTLDKKNGSLISLKVPSVDFECNFTDFLFQKNSGGTAGETSSVVEGEGDSGTESTAN